MKKKILGNTDIRVSVAGFGVLPMGPSQLALPVEQGAEVIRYALEHGLGIWIRHSITEPIRISKGRWNMGALTTWSFPPNPSALIMME